MDDDLPILGEQPAIDLANTWYEHKAGVTDFLAEPRSARRWVTLIGGGAKGEDLARLRELRAAVRTLLEAASGGASVSARAVAIVNRHAAAACARAELVVSPSGARSSRIVFSGRGELRARLATSCIEVLTGPDAVRRCEGPGCRMFFVQDHGRRRFCHEGCSHRDRQRRYRRKQA